MGMYMRNSFSTIFFIGCLAGIVSFFSWMLLLSGPLSAIVARSLFSFDAGAEALSTLFSFALFLLAVLRIVFFLLVPVLLYRILIRDRSFVFGFFSCIISLFVGMVFFGLYMFWTNERGIRMEREAQETIERYESMAPAYEKAFLAGDGEY